MPRRYTDERGFDRVEYAPGEEPQVLTGVSGEYQEGNCPGCPGIFRVEEFGDLQIFCTHDCHRKRNQEER